MSAAPKEGAPTGVAYQALETETSVRQASAPAAAAASAEEPLPACITGQICLKLDDDEEWWGTEADLGDDAWGAAIVSLARYMAVIPVKREAGVGIGLDVMNLVISVAVMVWNLALQVGVLWYIWMFVVEPAVHSVQLTYRHFRAHVLSADGTMRPDAWENYELKDEICEIAMVNVAFYYSILLLWILTNMSEWRAIERLNRSFQKMQRVASYKEMLYFTETNSFEQGGPCLILGMTTGVRVMIYLTVIIPRFLISLFLCWLGMRMLTSSASFSDMVLNSLALGFVISIDELLCQAILPVGTRKHMEETNLFIKDGHTPKKLNLIQSGEWQGFQRTGILIVISFFYMVVYGEILQQVLPTEIRKLSAVCQPYVATLQEPLCSQWAYFGGGSCYPPGVGDRFDHDE